MEKLFNLYKTRRAVAEILEISPSMVTMIKNGERQLTAKRARMAVEKSGGKLTLNDLLL